MAKLLKKRKISFLFFLTVLIAFISPLSLLILGIFIFNKTNPIMIIKTEEVTKNEEKLSPSQILANKSKYSQQEIVIRGRVNQEPVVCERKECPTNDICCGCPAGRDLILTDSGKILTSEEGTLRLVENVTEKPLCQRIISSCEYHCSDWIRGAIYDVSGKFFADSPPPGWQMSLNYYFQINGKELVKRISFMESLRSFGGEIKNKITSFKTSGQFVLP